MYYFTGVIRGVLCSRNVANIFRVDYLHFNSPPLLQMTVNHHFYNIKTFQLLRVFISSIVWQVVCGPVAWQDVWGPIAWQDVWGSIVWQAVSVPDVTGLIVPLTQLMDRGPVDQINICIINRTGGHCWIIDKRLERCMQQINAEVNYLTIELLLSKLEIHIEIL